jgi:hypothetical protein
MVRTLDKVLVIIRLHPELSLYQTGTYYMGIKIFNSLPFHIKDLAHNIKQFKLVLKNFLYSNYSYALDEYFNYNSI